MTPHASPSYRPPAKRSRLSKSTYRVLNVWAQLAERYNKRLDEDDIVDLYSGAIISDRGVLKNGKDYDFGHFAPDASQDDQDQEQEQEDGAQDQDDDLDELDTLPVRRGSGTDGTMASTSELLRAVPPLSATTDADDLDDFLEAEKRRRELLGDEDGEDDMSMEELAALREALHESEEDEERLEIVEPEDAAVSEEEDSEDELSIWQHDEASAVYRIARNESEQDIAEGEQKILESPDSDEEFAALLERPSRVGKRKRTPSPSPSQQSISLSFSQRCISPSPSQRSSSPSPSQRHFSPSPSSSSKRKSPLSLSQRGTSSESTLVPDTPSTTASTRFASHTPRTEVHPFASPSVDPTQPPQYLLYQAMQQLSYALSATMLSYGSPHMPPPPIAPWSAHPPGFSHPWGLRGASVTPLSFQTDDERTPVDHDGGVVENDRRRRRPTSPIGSGKDARKSERRKGVHPGRSYEEKYQGQRTAGRGRTPGTPSPVRGSKGSASTNKKKSNAKWKS